MQITNEKKYTLLKPEKDLQGEYSSDFIRECEIEIAKHNSDIFLFDLADVKKVDKSSLSYLITACCSLKNKYYCINANSSLFDIFRIMQLDNCIKFIDSLDEI